MASEILNDFLCSKLHPLVMKHIVLARNLSCWGGEGARRRWIFPGDRIEAPKAPIGYGMGRGFPLPTGEREELCPSPENILVFDLNVVNYGVF